MILNEGMNFKKSSCRITCILLLPLLLINCSTALTMNGRADTNIELLTFEKGYTYQYTWEVPPAGFSMNIDVYITDITEDHWEGIIVQKSADLDSFLYKFRVMKEDLKIFSSKQLTLDQLFDEEITWKQIMTDSSENPIIIPLVFVLNSQIYEFDLDVLLDQKSMSAIWSGGVQANLSLYGPVSYSAYHSFQVVSKTKAEGMMPETMTTYYVSTAEPYVLLYQTSTVGSTENYTIIELISVEEKTFDPEDYDLQEPVSEDNTLPIARFNFEISDLTVSLDASESSDTDGELVSYHWDFGDGQSGSGQQVNHTYDSSGNFSITLTVTDDLGASDSKNITIMVQSMNQSKPVSTPGFELLGLMFVLGFMVFRRWKKNE